MADVDIDPAVAVTNQCNGMPFKGLKSMLLINSEIKREINLARIVSLFILLLSMSTRMSARPIIPADDILVNLVPGHPRLMLADNRLAELKKLADSDVILQKYATNVLAGANNYLEAGPLVYDVVGPRLLHVSRACKDRIYYLALAYRWTSEKKYAVAAIENMRTVCSFPDWNKSHFLDVAEMAHAVAIGYDWLFHFMQEDDRSFIKKHLVDKALVPGMAGLAGEYIGYNGWTDDEHNWNQVCNGGLIIAALAIAETDPGFARFIIPRAVASLPTALVNYAPDGAWMEGPGYWHYATNYTAYAFSAMQTALGTTFGLEGSEGLEKTGYFPVYATGPTGLYLNYADNSERKSRGSMPCLFWLANNYNNSFFADAEHEMALKFGPRPEHVIWYRPRSTTTYKKDLDRYFGGPVEIALLRSSWESPKALFVGIKAGYNQVNHGHLDLGNFELDALGKRWVRDLGSDYYNLPGYFDKKPGGARWQYYRMLSVSHNVPVICDQNQHVISSAKFTNLKLGVPEPTVTVDMSEAYSGYAKVERTVTMTDQRKSVEIKDSFTMEKDCDILWGITTDASIELAHHSATMTIDNEKMIVTLLSPKNAEFVVESAEQQPPQAKNKGVKRLLIHLANPKQKTVIKAKFSPVWDRN